MMVIIVPVIPSSSVRASSGVPWNASGDRGPTLTDDSAAPAARATSTDSVGSTHSDPRAYSRSASRPTMPHLHDPALAWAGRPADPVSAETPASPGHSLAPWPPGGEI